jgi:hypothetical protein
LLGNQPLTKRSNAGRIQETTDFMYSRIYCLNSGNQALILSQVT